MLLTACADSQPTTTPPPLTPTTPPATASSTASAIPPTAPATPEVLVLVNGTLIDGTGADPLPDAVLVIQKGRITAVGQRDAVPLPTGARIVDVQGATILPGFINAHVHDAYSARNLAAWAQAGATTVRDEGILTSRSLPELIARRDGQWNQPQYARLVSAGWMIAAPNSYGRRYVSSPAQAGQTVSQELADDQADLAIVKF